MRTGKEIAEEMLSVRGGDLTIVVLEFLQHRLPNPLHHAALDLALMGLRVDDRSHVMGGDHVEHLDLAGIPVHFHLSDLSAEIHDIFRLRCIVLDGQGER